MTYQHPLAYLVGIEGLALLRAWAGDHDYDEDFVRARLAEVKMLLDDATLADHPGVHVGRAATDTAYQQWSASYDDPGNPLFDLDEPVIDEIVDGVSIGTVVDAACGTGRLAARLTARGHRVVGVDSSLAMLQRAGGRPPGMALVAGDLRRMPLADGAVDLVVSGLALSHVADLEPVYAEFARLLRPDGHLVVSDVHPDLVLLGSVVKATGAGGQPQLAATARHSGTDHLRAALAAGFSARRCEELPRPAKPEGPLPESTSGLGDWRDWPWTLLGRAPEATRAAWNIPAVTVWHFQRG